MNRSHIQAGIAGMALLGWTQIAPAQEMAKLPYQHVAHIQKVQSELTRTYPNLQVAIRMQSTDFKVKTSSLDVFVDTKHGRVPVKIDEDGSFSIPMTDELEKENPWIITNQPRGTMQLGWEVGLKAGQIALEMNYRDLMQPLKDCVAVQEKMRSVFPDAPKMSMVGINLTYAASLKEPAVVISTKKGDKKLQTDDHGNVIIPYLPDLLEENPAVHLPQLPAKVEIVKKKSSE